MMSQGFGTWRGEIHVSGAFVLLPDGRTKPLTPFCEGALDGSLGTQGDRCLVLEPVNAAFFQVADSRVP